MKSIFIKEIQSFFNSLIAYIVIGIFLTGLGLYIWVFPDTILDYGTAEMSVFFQACPFVFMFLVPGITMKSFAEEKNQGTIELLFTKPLTEWEIILGKYFASVVIVLMSLIPTLLYVYTIYSLGDPVGNLDVARVIGSYIGLLLLGAVFAAIGIFASSITSNQIIAFSMAVFMSLILFEGVTYISQLMEWSSFSVVIQFLSLSIHYQDLSKGVIDSRDVLFMLSIIALFLGVTRLVLQSRKW